MIVASTSNSRPEQQEHPEASATGRQLELEPARPRIHVPDPHHRAVGRAQQPAVGSSGLDGGLDDHEPELFWVECRGQRVAEARIRVTQALPLVLEVGQPCLQLLGHLVEGSSHSRELVPAAHLNPLVQTSGRDRVCRSGELAEGADDRPTGDVRDEADQQQGGEQAGDQLRSLGLLLSDDRRRRSDRGKRDGWLAQEPDADDPVARRADHGCLDAALRRDDLARDAALRGCLDASAHDRRELIGLPQTGPGGKPLDERRVDGHRGDDRRRSPSRPDERDRRLRCGRRRAPNPESVWGLDPERPISCEKARERDPVAALDRRLEVPVARQSLRSRLDRSPLVLVGRDRRAKPRFEPGVDAARNAPVDDLAEAPVGRCERQERERDQRGDQLELEASHLGLQFPPRPADIRSRTFVGKGGREHESEFSAGAGGTSGSRRNRRGGDRPKAARGRAGFDAEDSGVVAVDQGSSRPSSTGSDPDSGVRAQGRWRSRLRAERDRSDARAILAGSCRWIRGTRRRQGTDPGSAAGRRSCARHADGASGATSGPGAGARSRTRSVSPARAGSGSYTDSDSHSRTRARRGGTGRSRGARRLS